MTTETRMIEGFETTIIKEGDSVTAMETHIGEHDGNPVLVVTDSMGPNIIYGGSDYPKWLLSSRFASHADAIQVAAKTVKDGPDPKWKNMRSEQNLGESLFNMAMDMKISQMYGIDSGPEPEDPIMAKYGDEWYHKEIIPIGQPLPKPGEPYHKAWGGMWDYYGYFLFGKGNGKERPPHWDYNCSLDNLFNEWTLYLLEVLGELKKKYREKHPDVPGGHFVPMSDFAVPVFDKLYGGFTFAPFMKMITTDPANLDAKLKRGFETVFQEVFSRLLNEFVAKRGITIDQIPTREVHEESSMTAMRDVLRRHMKGGQSMDYSDKLGYSVGMELKDGRIFEKSAYALYMGWSMSNSMKDIAIASAGLRIKMEEMNAGRKLGCFAEWLLKVQMKAVRKRMRGWGVYTKDNKGKEVRFDIRDVARFYPPPHSGLGPVKNPIR